TPPVPYSKASQRERYYDAGFLYYTSKFFFFQAEDGIRDRNVTGVQTCALPIWSDRSIFCGQGRPPCYRAGGQQPSWWGGATATVQPARRRTCRRRRSRSLCQPFRSYRTNG